MESLTVVGGVLLVTASAFVAALYWLVRRFAIARRDWIAASVIFVWCAGIGVKVYLGSAVQTVEADPLAAALMLGPIQGQRASVQTSVTPASVAPATREALPSVATMIRRLEERLENEPADQKGWALLAQSYAFVGNSTAAAIAIERAVALGANELDLRARVDGASREAHPNVAGAVVSAGL
jgi:cytochrome c-type biogenesis protein CcmH/NrfG